MSSAVSLSWLVSIPVRHGCAGIQLVSQVTFHLSIKSETYSCLVWGACLAAGTQDITLNYSQFVQVLFGIWSSVTVTHCAFCTFK